MDSGVARRAHALVVQGGVDGDAGGAVAARLLVLLAPVLLHLTVLALEADGAVAPVEVVVVAVLGGAGLAGAAVQAREVSARLDLGKQSLHITRNSRKCC